VVEQGVKALLRRISYGPLQLRVAHGDVARALAEEYPGLATNTDVTDRICVGELGLQ
jgi:hypothetical protein